MAKASRASFGDVIVSLGKENKKILVLDADLGGSTKTDKFNVFDKLDMLEILNAKQIDGEVISSESSSPTDEESSFDPQK